MFWSKYRSGSYGYPCNDACHHAHGYSYNQVHSDHHALAGPGTAADYSPIAGVYPGPVVHTIAVAIAQAVACAFSNSHCGSDRPARDWHVRRKGAEDSPVSG